MQEQLILTNVGKAKLASATPEDQLQIAHVAVGDGNGGYPPLDPTMTALVNEVWRGPASAPIRDPNNGAVLIFEGVIPAAMGGFDIREFALFDDAGDMIAIGQTSLVEKPAPGVGSPITLTVRVRLVLANASQTDLIIGDAPYIDHQGTANRDAPDAHPIEAITGLPGALDDLESEQQDLRSDLTTLSNAFEAHYHAGDGVASVALGPQAEAEGDAALALGPEASAAETGSTAVGRQASAGGYRSTAIGDQAKAPSPNSLAAGVGANAAGGYSVALGHLAGGTGSHSTALGSWASAGGSQSVALGSGASTGGAAATAVGPSANALGEDSAAIGNGAAAVEDGAIALGQGAYAEGEEAMALGRASAAYEAYSVALGPGAQADSQAVAIGFQATASGHNSVAIGTLAYASGTNVGVLGESSMAWGVPGDFSVAGTKNFEIPHPSPEKRNTHVLRHGAVEAPTAGDTLYRFAVEASEPGETVAIQLPGYFAHLNTNVDAWVNGKGHFGRAFGEIVENELRVTCELPGAYRVLVIGTRNDGHPSVQGWGIRGVEREVGETWAGETLPFEVDELVEVEEFKEF